MPVMARAAVAIHAAMNKNRFSLQSVEAAEFAKAEGHYLSGIVKLNMRLWHDLTDEDVLELFSFMDVSKDGAVDSSEFSNLLSNALDPPLTDPDLDALFKSIDKDRGGTLTPSELKAAMFSGSLKSSLERMHEERRLQDKKKEELKAKGPPVSRELMAERIAWRVSRDDSFYTLPFTLVFIMVFILVVISHLQILKRFKLQKGMEDWVNGYGADYPGPYLGDHVGNFNHFMQWLSLSGLPMALGECDGTGCPVAPRSLLVGDVKLVKTLEDGSIEQQWLLHTPEARAHLELDGQSTDYLGAAKQTLNRLSSASNPTQWAPGLGAPFVRIRSLELVFASYTEDEEAFSVTSAYFKIDSKGAILPDTTTRAVVINPYADLFLGVIDTVYVLMILWSAKVEFEQYWIRGCRGYWDHCGPEGAWNAVDLFGVMMGILNCVQWVSFIMLVGAPEIHDVLMQSDGGHALIPNAMSLPLTTIETLESQLRAGSDAYSTMQLAMGVNVGSIMMKLFKSFGANARLQLVTNTMFRAAPDLFHFGVVFTAVFIGFALTGHILFGEDIEEFRSFGLSVNTAFESLLGDFDWYSDRVISPKELGSGLPYWMVVLWFYVYMIGVMLVMMNMLLAIVMDHYCHLLEEVREEARLGNAPTLWVQSRNMYNRWRAQRGWLSGNRVLHQLVDLHHHPEEEVTPESMKKAFGKMTDVQVESLMKQLKQEAAKRAKGKEEDETTRVLTDIKSTLADLGDQVRIVTHTVCRISARVDHIEEYQSHTNGSAFVCGNGEASEASTKAPDPPQKQQATEDLEKILSDLRGVVGQLQEQQRRVDQRQQAYDAAIKMPPPSQLPRPPEAPYYSYCSSISSRPPEYQLQVTALNR
jgi:hypothetical protein